VRIASKYLAKICKTLGLWPVACRTYGWPVDQRHGRYQDGPYRHRPPDTRDPHGHLRRTGYLSHDLVALDAAAGFQATYRQARREAYLFSRLILHNAANGAVTTVLTVMSDTTVPCRIRVDAADCVLEYSEGCGYEDLASRIGSMEPIGEQVGVKQSGLPVQ
jgi:hypothetical protein